MDCGVNSSHHHPISRPGFIKRRSWASTICIVTGEVSVRKDQLIHSKIDPGSGDFLAGRTTSIQLILITDCFGRFIPEHMHRWRNANSTHVRTYLSFSKLTLPVYLKVRMERTWKYLFSADDEDLQSNTHTLSIITLVRCYVLRCPFQSADVHLLTFPDSSATDEAISGTLSPCRRAF